MPRSGWILAEEKPWSMVVVGDLVSIESDHGRVTAANVDPLFCAHTFEDGRTISHPRDLPVKTKRPATDAEVAEIRGEEDDR